MRDSSPSGRGGRWVLGQFVLFALIAASWLLGAEVTSLGFVLAGLGVVLAVWAGITMGDSLSPFPQPRRRAQLVDRGPFRVLRHPIYVGGVLFFAGVSLALSAYGLAPTALLAAFWLAKARLEERHLLARFPEYEEYRRRTWF